MLYTPLHRILGEPPGPLSETMIDAAIEQGIEESSELDWKARLPEQRAFKLSDHVKDIAAFSNAGGGILVFGVIDTQARATSRSDAGDCDENYERTIQQTCMTAITPPVFGVTVHRVGVKPTRAVAIVVPPSIDGPHLIYKGENFGAPVRVGADTHWMREREIEAAYRSRFAAAQRAQRELALQYDEMTQAFDADECAVFVAVARPRSTTPSPKRRLMMDAAIIMSNAKEIADGWLREGAGYHPLEDLSPFESRPGLRSWVARSQGAPWRDARAAVSDDGSVSLAWRAGGHRFGAQGEHLQPWQVSVRALEGFAASTFALVRSIAQAQPLGDMDVQIGVEWVPSLVFNHRLEFMRDDGYAGAHRRGPLGAGFRPVAATVDPSSSDDDFRATVRDVATDCVNQVGFRALQTLVINS